MRQYKNIPLNNANNLLRQKAIEIIENVIEPLLKKGLNGDKYYDLEDKITQIIARDIAE